MPNTYSNSQLKIITLNKTKYLPYQLHQLPKFFDRDTTDYFSKNGYCYVSLNDHSDSFNLQNFKNRLTFNKDIQKTLKR